MSIAEVLAGQIILADHHNALATPGWTTYGSDTTSLTATSVNPTKGNSSYSFEYSQPNNDMVTIRFIIAVGSTFVAGTGAYRYLLPVSASAGAQTGSVGALWVNDSGTALQVGVLIIADATHAEGYLQNITGNALGAAGPGTAWANGDSIRGTISYEPA